MLKHADVWQGIDRLARKNGLSPSGLARRAGLDPTTFNPSKRVTKQNKPRWPSTESVAKILQATQTSFADFVTLMSDEAAVAPRSPSNRVRCLGFDQAERADVFDQAGFPVGEQWDELEFPNLDDPHAYALEIRGSALQPVYRDGDFLIISPAAHVRRHDRIVLKKRSGQLLAGVLMRRTAQRVELAHLVREEDTQTFSLQEVDWIARIIWASQ